MVEAMVVKMEHTWTDAPPEARVFGGDIIQLGQY